MMTREECFNALEHLKKWVCADNVDDMVVFRQLINEHFDPEPYKFEDLIEGMWVWDDELKEYRKILKVYVSDIYHDMFYENVKVIRVDVDSSIWEEYAFEEERFYPIQKANDRICYE